MKGQPLVRWTPAMDGRLMDLMALDTPIKEICADMGLTRHQIHGRFRRLIQRSGRQYT